MRFWFLVALVCSLLAFRQPATAAVIGDVGWTQCGVDGDTCTPASMSERRYGIDDYWVSGDSRATPFVCGPVSFGGGDPAPQILKGCWIKPVSTSVDPPPPPASGASSADALDPATLAKLGVDAQQVAKVTSWGFGAVIFLWYLGAGIGVAVQAIRKL